MPGKNLLLIIVTLSLVGCAQVKPWERGNLARPEMSLEPDPMGAGLDHHIYSSKEAASGGYGVGGGGCGCN